jgi:hypothetical protein
MSNPWSLARGGAIVFAALLLGLGSIAVGQQQETKPEAKDQKPPLTPPTTGLLVVDPLSNVKGKAGILLKLDKPAEPSLEEMLNKALKDNPDIRVAESKVREAEAELNRTRLQVTQKVLAFHHTHEAQKAAIKVAEEELARIRKFLQSKAVSQAEVQQAENRLSQAKAKLAEIDAEMPYLLGQEHAVALSVAVTEQLVTTLRLRGPVETFMEIPPWSRSRIDTSGVQPVTGTTLEKIRKALDIPVTLDYKDADAAQVLKDLEKKVPGISFHVVARTNVANLHSHGPVPLGAALQLVEDTFTELFEGGATARCSFAIRDYGILFTSADRIPPKAIQLDDLLREKAQLEWIKKQSEDKKSTGDKK